MSSTSNLPNWIGADGAYSRAYRILANMANAGHVTRHWRIGKKRDTQYCIVSQDMRDYIDALNEGVEERVKGLNLQYAAFDR